MTVVSSWRWWRASVTQLLENWLWRIAWSWEHFIIVLYVDRMSALSSVSIWWWWGSSWSPGCLRRGEPGQGLKAAAQSPHAEWQWDSILELKQWWSLIDTVRPTTFTSLANFLISFPTGCTHCTWCSSRIIAMANWENQVAPVAQSVSAPYL